MPALLSLSIQRGLRLPPAFPVSRREIMELGGALLDVLGLSGCSLDLHLVDDADMARRNAEFMGCMGPTNVLSFPAGEQGGDEGAGETGQGP